MAYLTDGSGNRLTDDTGADLLTDGSDGGTHPVGKVSCLGLSGYGVGRRTAIFGGKGGGISGPHPVSIVSRLGLDSYGVRRYRTFSGKPNADQGPHSVAILTRLSLDGYGVRRAGTFAGKGAPGGTHAVSRITRLGLDGYGVRRAGSFTGRNAPSSHPVGLLTRLGLDGYGVRRYRTFAGKGVVVAPPIVVPPVGAPAFPEHPYRGGKELKREIRALSEVIGDLETGVVPKVEFFEDEETRDFLRALHRVQRIEAENERLAAQAALLREAYLLRAALQRLDDEEAILAILLSI